MESNMHTTKITQTLALAGFAPAGKLSHLYCGLLPVLALLVATLGKPNWRKRAYAVFVLCAATAIALSAQTFTTLFSFDGTDGVYPTAGLVQATNGDFYGTTYAGGANYGGTVFKTTPGGTPTTLYSFCSQGVYPSCTDGANPQAVLVQASNGDIYGTTSLGGANGPYYGTIFKITPSGTLTTLYSFCTQSDCTDGSEPFAGLVQATDGNFYGTTAYRGAHDGGTVFKITPSGTLTTLHSFCGQMVCPNGTSPQAGLVQATNGDFYGTTAAGANPGPAPGSGAGTVFKITPSGTLTTLYSFCAQSGCTDGDSPEAVLVQATNGDFYGTTAYGGANTCLSNGYNIGCGTVFKITPGGTLTTLYSFCSKSGCTDGELPAAGLVQATNGDFYGTTYYDDEINCVPEGGCGTVFKMTPSGTLTTLYSFCSQSACTDGSEPYAGLVQATNGDFYGTATEGGANNDGTVFRLSVGLGPFVETQTTSGEVGAVVKILGNDLTGATSVSFNSTAAVFEVSASSLITTIVPAGASTGTVQVVTPSRTLSSNVPFRVLP
jgi:uncharacterized repeat protein (TIGR03803 family)